MTYRNNWTTLVSTTQGKTKENSGKIWENNTGKRQKVHQDDQCQQVDYFIYAPKHQTLFIYLFIRYDFLVD